MSRSTAPVPNGLTDAPVVREHRLTQRQRDGESCAWCSDWASPRHPIPLLRGDARLRACETCAALYGVPEVGR